MHTAVILRGSSRCCLLWMLCDLQTEIAELRQQRQGSDSSATRNGVEKLKKEYLQKLNLLEDQVNICLWCQ